MIDYCLVTNSICQYPAESIKKWGIETVRDYLAYETHVDGCSECQRKMDELLAANKDKPRRPDPSSLN